MNEIPANRNHPPILDVSAESIPPSPALNDCWDKIGVGGDGSCVELEKHVHCRNCPVYSRAAGQLLNRSLPREDRREWTAHYALPKKISALGKISVVIFRLGQEWLALPTLAFQEIAERRAIHSLPHRRGGIVLGLTNVRGELLVCVSLARMLEIFGDDHGADSPPTRTPNSPTSAERLMVTAWDGQRVAFPVNEVHGVQRLQSEELKEPPANVGRSPRFASGIFSWRDHTVGLLDADALFMVLNQNLS